MDSLSTTYLGHFRSFRITRNGDYYIVWILREINGHFVAEKLSASTNASQDGRCFDVVSLVLPCCSVAPTDVDGEQVFLHACLISRSVDLPTTLGSTACCPNEHSPFASSQSCPGNLDALHRPCIPSNTTEPWPISQASDLTSSNASATTSRLAERNRKRMSPNAPSQHAPIKRKLTATEAATRLSTQLSSSVKNFCEQRILASDNDIAQRLIQCHELLKSNPNEVDDQVEQLQLWLQQGQQQSNLHFSALQHLLSCVDLYNWWDRSDENTEKTVNKRRWFDTQLARYRNKLANELCKTKNGTSDRLGLVTLAPMTVKGLKFAHLDKATDQNKTEIIQHFACLARPELEKQLKDSRVIKAINPVSFVCWFLGKPFKDVCEALSFTELSFNDCGPSSNIWHEIQGPSTAEVFNGSNLPWPLLVAVRTEESQQSGSHEEPMVTGLSFSEILEDTEGALGFM
ncbi:uncharacterized protein FMAN_02070 [Fusarium mangiferae]|uniref:Uncharacterized protein n=1 Tax=Fusarium mangiferae TaxID=192010 RepID=A0A1L7SPN3_FUSMA|nr:uncharacterized protein FMAN_02070 [Fusarium mangiferae]CVK85166.1 uncharacterized protein FMAN_02070 [Fusarium mangiferae]